MQLLGLVLVSTYAAVYLYQLQYEPTVFVGDAATSFHIPYVYSTRRYHIIV